MDWWIILLTIIISALGNFVWRTMMYFHNTGIPHDTPFPFVGNVGPIILRKVHLIEHINYYYYRWLDAKYVGFYDLTTPVLIVRDPELIKTIGVKHFDNFVNHTTIIHKDADPLFGQSLFSLNDDKWRNTRNLLSPSFTSSKIKLMFELMTDCATIYSRHAAEQGETDIDVKSFFSKYTNDVIATCAFGISIDSVKDPENEFYVNGRKGTAFTAIQILKTILSRSNPTLCKWLGIRFFDVKMTNFFKQIIHNTMETRKKEGIYRPDMLQLMMEQNENSEYKLNEIEMTAQAFLFFLGGFETTSNLMSYATVALSLNPNIQNILLKEIDQILQDTNGKPTYDAINSMPMLDAVLNETLRLYPIFGFTDRVCTKSFELPPAFPGGKPFTVKPGLYLWFPINGIQTDPKNYDSPRKFDPYRFLRQKMSVGMPTFLPFGIGPRACIGNRFALIETKLILFHLLSKCRLEVSNKLKQPIKMAKISIPVSGVIDGGFWVKFVPRK